MKYLSEIAMTLSIASVQLQGDEGVRLSVTPAQSAFVRGTTIGIALDFQLIDGDPQKIELGSSGLDNVLIHITSPDGTESDAKYREIEGFQPHSHNKILVDGRCTYDFFLEEFTTLTLTGKYRINISIKGTAGLSGIAEFSVIEDGLTDLKKLADIALDRRQLAEVRLNAGRALSYCWRTEAVPYLMELMKQYDFHGSNVIADATRSILRSNDASGIKWLWEEAGRGKVMELPQNTGDFIRAIVARDARDHPTRVKAENVK